LKEAPSVSNDLSKLSISNIGQEVLSASASNQLSNKAPKKPNEQKKKRYSAIDRIKLNN
jgi:hypothetical protein